MLTRSWKCTGALLPFAAILAVSAGCSSTNRESRGVADSRQDDQAVATRHESREFYRANERDGRDVQVADTSTLRTERSLNASRDRSSGSGLATAADRQNRVTVTMDASNPPPLMRTETPAHHLADNEFWVPGHWRGESGQYVWQAGRIEHYQPGRLYHPANWEPTRRGWEYTPEFWY